MIKTVAQDKLRRSTKNPTKRRSLQQLNNMQIELTDGEIVLLKIALQRAAFNEAEIALTLSMENTIGPKFLELKGKICAQQFSNGHRVIAEALQSNNKPAQ